MRNSTVSFKHLLRVALLALPVLLLLGLHGRVVTVGRAGGTQLRDAGKSTVIKQRIAFEAASPLLAHYEAPAALGWLPAALPVAWPAHLLRRAVAAAPVAASAAFVAQLCRQRLLAWVLSPQAP